MKSRRFLASQSSSPFFRLLVGVNRLLFIISNERKSKLSSNLIHRFVYVLVCICVSIAIKCLDYIYVYNVPNNYIIVYSLYMSLVCICESGLNRGDSSSAADGPAGLKLRCMHIHYIMRVRVFYL